MDYDLNRGLREMSDESGAHGTDLPVDQLVRRAHRRRAARTAAIGAVGATSVAALAFGGVALADNLGRTTVPPAVEPIGTTTPGPTTATTEPTTATPTPAETTYQPDFSACGTTIDSDLYDPDVDLSVFDVEATTVDPGQDITVPMHAETTQPWGGEQASLAPIEAVTTTGTSGSEPGWTVVAVPSAPLQDPVEAELWAGDGIAGMSMDVDIPFVMCPDTEAAGQTPPVGTYTLWIRAQLVHGETELTQWGRWSVIVDEPDTIDPAAEPTEPPSELTEPEFDGTVLPESTTRIGPAMDQYGCGDDPSAYRLDGTWQPTTGTYTAEAGAAVESGDPVVTMQVHRAGAPLGDTKVRFPSFYVVGRYDFASDYSGLVPGSTSRVIGAGNLGGLLTSTGSTLGGPTLWASVPDWPQGEAVRLQNDVGPSTCTFMLGTEWPSGTYRVYPFTEVVAADGTVVEVKAPVTTFTLP